MRAPGGRFGRRVAPRSQSWLCMRYAIISNPRDRISSGLGQAGSIAIVSFQPGDPVG